MKQLPTIEGQDADLPRISTGLHSLDILVSDKGKVGYPLRTISELYAYEGVGKSTLATYLAGKVKSDGLIVIADLEGGLSKQHLRSNLVKADFIGTIRFTSMVEKGKPRSHEAIVGETLDSLMNDDASAVIIDSIGAYTPASEAAGDIGDANMGKPGKAFAQVSRRLMSHVRLSNDPCMAILVNHVHQVMGGFGHWTPGGVKKQYAAAVRLYMYRKEVNEKWGGAYLVEVKAEKLRHGGLKGEDRALVFIIPGVGVSPEMTALFDCMNLGLVTRGKHIKVEDKSYGYLKNLVQKAADGTDPELFNDFKELLQ